MKIDARAGYMPVHMAKAILFFGKGPVGRPALVSALRLGEASVRTLLRNMEKNKIITVSAKGHVITRKGQSVYASLSKNIHGPFSSGDISKNSVAYVVKNAAHKITNGVKQRDQAVRFGADGLLTLVRRDRVFAPSVRLSVPERLANLMEKNDVMLIGISRNMHTADLAALHCALLLTRGYHTII